MIECKGAPEKRHLPHLKGEPFGAGVIFADSSGIEDAGEDGVHVSQLKFGIDH